MLVLKIPKNEVLVIGPVVIRFGGTKKDKRNIGIEAPSAFTIQHFTKDEYEQRKEKDDG